MMNQSWSFHNPVTIRFGAGGATRPLPWRRVLLVTTPGMVRRGVVERLVHAWSCGEVRVCDEVTPNPELATLDALAERLRAEAPFDAIVALGGGSTVDTGKILSVLLGTRSAFTLAAHFRAGISIPSDTLPLPVVAIPTTSGTGSEVTPFATVWDSHARKKYSLASPLMFPHEARLDPELTYDLPWEITLSTGLDAFCQALESIWNRRANPITLGLAFRSARLAWDVLREGQAWLDHPRLRKDMMEASLLAGLAISHTRTALCHSISYPITIHYGVPHGLACAFSMAEVLRFNLPADDGRLGRVAGELGCPSGAALADAIMVILEELGLKRMMSEYLGAGDSVLKKSSEMLTVGRSDNNLREVSEADIRTVLKKCLR